jgi:hypothetical protein
VDKHALDPEGHVAKLHIFQRTGYQEIKGEDKRKFAKGESEK